MVAVWLDILDAADFVLVALQGSIAAVLLFFVALPKFDCHVPSTTGQVFSRRTESHVIDHAGMLT